MTLPLLSSIFFYLRPYFASRSVATRARSIGLTKAARQELRRKPFVPFFSFDAFRAEERERQGSGERENRGARKSGRKCGKSPWSSAITLSVREIAADCKGTLSSSLSLSVSFSLFLSPLRSHLSFSLCIFLNDKKTA